MSLAPAPAAFLDAAPTHGWRRWATPRLALLAIAAAYSVVVLTQVLWFDYLTHDEVVYASQFGRGAHPMYMSAPRAWGMPLLMAPVDMFTTSTQVMRIYFGILAGVGLYLAFHPWLRVSAAWVAPIAAGLFVTLWTSILYGALAYPNLWLGFALVAGIGWAWRALDDGDRGGEGSDGGASGSPGARDGRDDRRVLLWLLVAFGFASMVRPIDAGIVALPLLVFLAWKRARGPLLSVAAGLSIGVGVWVIESFLRFGDPIDRLRQGADNIGAGVGLTVVRLLEAVDGPQFLCRPAERCSDIHLLEVVWWLALPVLAVVGITVARRRWPYLLPVAGGALLATSYAILSDWTNTRFLQPAYLLLALPVARGVLAGLQARRAIAVMVIALVVAHTGMQMVTYRRVARIQIDNAHSRQAEVAFLRDMVGVDPPCVVYLPSGPTVPYSLGCETRIAPERPALDDPGITDALASGRQVIVLLRNEDIPPVAPTGWRVERESPRSRTYALVSTP